MKIICIALALGIFGLASCTKPANKTTTGNILGLWKPSMIAKDENHNGVMDSNEAYVDTNGYYYFFNSNGTGTTFFVPSGGDTAYFNWTFLNNGQNLQIAYTNTTLPGWALNTSICHIDTLTATSLILKFSDTASTDWETYKR